MAPRVRPRKVGLKRMDAAIDALTPMGFSAELIRQKVKDLLKVYDGDEGWAFIEEAAYKLLIEYILEEQEGGQCEQREPSFGDSPNEARAYADMDTEASEAGPSSEASEPPCSSQQTPLATSVTDTPLASPVAVLEALCPPLVTVISPCKNSTSNKVNRTEDVIIDKEKIAALTEAYYMVSGPPPFEHFPLEQGFVPRKHKPCLGWIGAKDDNDFVLLEPMPVRGCSIREKRRKRKSRWDVGPNDVV